MGWSLANPRRGVSRTDLAALISAGAKKQFLLPLSVKPTHRLFGQNNFVPAQQWSKHAMCPPLGVRTQRQDHSMCMYHFSLPVSRGQGKTGFPWLQSAETQGSWPPPAPWSEDSWGSHLAVKIKCLCFYHKIWLHYIQAIKWIEYSLWESQAFTSWTRNCIERVHSWAPEITKQQDYESGVLVWGPDFVGYVNLRQPLPVPVSSSVRTWNALFCSLFYFFFFFLAVP